MTYVYVGVACYFVGVLTRPLLAKLFQALGGKLKSET